MSSLRTLRNIIRRIKYRRLYGLHELLREFTMISRETYVANLKLVLETAHISGAIVECGTWKGGMIAGIARLLGGSREYYLFDSFEGLPPAEPIDGVAARKWQENKTSPFYYDNCTASEADAAKAMAIAGIKDYHSIKGWFEDTLPKANFSSGIAILRLDADWYKSTKHILDSLFSKVNEGGIILIDDYYTWDGCSRAVHDYLSEHGCRERIRCFDGVCFIRKAKVELSY